MLWWRRRLGRLLLRLRGIEGILFSGYVGDFIYRKESKALKLRLERWFMYAKVSCI